MNISAEEMKTFGKILGLVGKSIEKDPELIISLLNSRSGKDKKRHQSSNESEMKIISSNEPDSAILFDMAKEKSKKELIDILERYSVNQLRSVIKQLRFSSIRSKSISVLSEYIADQLKKRTTDVFRNHLSVETGSNGEVEKVFKGKQPIPRFGKTVRA